MGEREWRMNDIPFQVQADMVGRILSTIETIMGRAAESETEMGRGRIMLDEILTLEHPKRLRCPPNERVTLVVVQDQLQQPP